MPLPLLALGTAACLVAVPAGLALQFWLGERPATDADTDRPDPETLRADLAAANPTPEARDLRRLRRLPETRAQWDRLDREHLDLEHRLRRAVNPDRRQDQLPEQRQAAS